MFRTAFVLMMFVVSTGCASKFDGEWVEAKPADKLNTCDQRMALAFHPPSLLRVGLVSPKMDVVDGKTVQQSGYYLFDGWKKAQLGTMMAKVDGDEMTTFVGCTEKKFVRVKGKSIFPPRLVLYPWG